ncbi:MAG: dipeptide epimerase [Deltaproteobacteria bacterium]|nr:dipeptide epimerase [Deltaproteobacteria bacterium]MDH3801016.1 dipeptide epimerase [Deltaproteobacteria bacterium]MDH3851789.1 dipeptide epimerase [Deltaproteobacteria bacterium]MDH3898397.1 dipeptide epimerase [Deltaproteobacteria bacterium]MDH3926625.1 dipeptide epimerase [Deltaproteobacteria bacterium]
MWLKKIDLYLLQIQLCMPIKHYLAERTHSENLVVKVVTDSGVVGFGEGIARQYVTGEVMESSLRFLQDHLLPQLNGFHPSGPPDLIEALAELLSEDNRAQAPAACCALELAILDAAGKTWSQSVAQMLGGGDQPLIYSAVIPMMSPPSFHRLLHLIRDMEMSFVKIKVGNKRDTEVLSLAREILGHEVDLRVDANGAWSSEEAQKRIAAMMAYGISAVEQPVPKEDIQGLKRLSQQVEIPIIADESLCLERDAENLASLDACQVFNLRLSKCGGILAANRLYEIARKKAIAAQLGCQVGETGILSAAGRQLASSRKLLYLEGSYSSYLLQDDIVNEPVEFGPGGVAQPLAGHGLGVSVNEETLQRLAVMHEEIRL